MTVGRRWALGAAALVVALTFVCWDRPPGPDRVEPSPPRAVDPSVSRLAVCEDVSLVELLERPDGERVPRPGSPPAAPMPPERVEEYRIDAVKSFAQLQPWRREVDLGPGLAIVDLHPRIHRAFILTAGGASYSLENRFPGSILVDLDASDREGLSLVHLADDSIERCAPWTGTPSSLALAASSGRAYVPICHDHLLVRNTVLGRRTTREVAAEFLRDKVVGGDHLVELVKAATRDKYREEAEVGQGAEAEADAAMDGPVPLRLSASGLPTLALGDMGLPVAEIDRAPAGQWLPVLRHPGIYVALVAPELTALPDDAEQRARLQMRNDKEGGALVFLAAVDLDQHVLEFEVGTSHPGVEWSQRAQPAQVDRALPGPDGIGSVAPFGRTGLVPSLEAGRLVASFVGGFKREHSAFVVGDLATRNSASHYGVIQDGLVMSKLQPGLATLVVFDDGAVDILTWSESMDAELDRILHARQNGVPLLQEVDGEVRVTPLIGNWRAGNWSGSATGEARTIRAGACIQDSQGGRFLLYGFFTSATPRSMARVFAAAGCTDAIHLDMNALEHTYMAVYDRDVEGAWTAHHLDRGMAVLDRKDRHGTVLPRFVAFPDNRDFFAVLRKGEP